MSDFITKINGEMKAERTRLEKELTKLNKDRASIDAQIAKIEADLHAMTAFEGVAAKVTTKTAAKKPRAAAAKKPAAKPAAKKPVAKPAAKKPAAKPAAKKPAAKPAARAAIRTPAKAAAKPAAKVALKTPAAKKPAAKASSSAGATAGRRDVILKMIQGSARGMSRSDLISALNVKGDKKQEKSISNALADLKRQNSVDLDGGVYKAKTGNVVQLPKTAANG